MAMIVGQGKKSLMFCLMQSLYSVEGLPHLITSVAA
jgi:hypothetical protein